MGGSKSSSKSSSSNKTVTKTTTFNIDATDNNAPVTAISAGSNSIITTTDFGAVDAAERISIEALESNERNFAGTLQAVSNTQTAANQQYNSAMDFANRVAIPVTAQQTEQMMKNATYIALAVAGVIAIKVMKGK